MKKIISLIACILLVCSMFACAPAAPAAAPADAPAAAPETAEAAAAPEEAASTEDFLIGVIQPLTGATGFGGTECQAALEIAAEEQGTLLGRPIKMIFSDAPDDTTATSEVERLMSVQGVKFFFGAYGFSSIPVQAAVMAKDGFIFETVTWETDLLSGGYENFFMNMVTAEEYANAAADYVLMLGKDYLGKDISELKVGIVGNTGFPSAMPSIVKARLESQGCAPVVYEIYDPTITDFTPIIMKLQSAGCDIVIPSQFASDAELFRKTCLSLGYEPPITFGTGVAYDEQAFSQIGEAAEGCMSISYTNPEMNLDSAKGLKEFREKFFEKTGHYPITHALMAYSGAKIFFQAVENAGSDDYAAIREALYALDIPAGELPAYWGAKFNPENNHNDRSGQPLVIGQWFANSEGNYEYKVVYPPELAVAEIVAPFGSID